MEDFEVHPSPGNANIYRGLPQPGPGAAATADDDADEVELRLNMHVCFSGSQSQRRSCGGPRIFCGGDALSAGGGTKAESKTLCQSRAERRSAAAGAVPCICRLHSDSFCMLCAVRAHTPRGEGWGGGHVALPPRMMCSCATRNRSFHPKHTNTAPSMLCRQQRPRRSRTTRCCRQAAFQLCHFQWRT